MNKFIFTLFLIISTTAYSQVTFGLRIEPMIYVIRDEQVVGYGLEERLARPLRASLSQSLIVNFQLDETVKLSLRPGLTLDKYFGGYDLTSLLLFDLNSQNQIIGGVNLHLNSLLFFDYGGDNGELYYFLVGGISQKLSEGTSLELQFNLALNPIEYAHHSEGTNPPDLIIRHHYFMPWFIKLSYGFN